MKPNHRTSPSSRRSGLTRIEAVVIAVIVILGGLMLGPWLLRQRASSRERTCAAYQFSVARSLILHADDQRYFDGYRNPIEDSIFDFESTGETERTSLGIVEPSLMYLFAYGGGDTDRNLKKTIAKRAEGEIGKGDYYERLIGLQNDADTIAVPAIPELNCPSQRRIDYRTNPDSSTTIFNCGMPDVASEQYPPDWRANGTLHDRTAFDFPQSPVTLNYIQDRDGLSSTLLLSENIDAAGWLSTRESHAGFVWEDFKDGKRDERLLGVNQQTGQRQSDDDFSFARPSSYHVGGVNVTFCDGSTKFINQNIDYVVFALMMSCDDTEVAVAGTDKPGSKLYRRTVVKNSK